MNFRSPFFWPILLAGLFPLPFCEGPPPESDASVDYPALRRQTQERESRALKDDIEKNFSGYDDLKAATEVAEHRMTGTKQGRAAETFVFEKLKSYGLSPRYHTFDILIWRRKSAALEIRAGEKIIKPASVSFAYTPLDSDVTAPIFDVGDGLAEDFAEAGDDLNGKIALVNLHIMNDRVGGAEDDKDDKDGEGGTEKKRKKRGNPHRSTRAAWAMRRGAVGVIFVNKYKGGVLTTGTVSKNDSPIKIPALCVSLDEGRAIRALLGNATGSAEDSGSVESPRVTARIQAKAETEKIQARNVIAEVPGFERPEESVMIGAHLDTWDLSPGAIDNGIGAFAVLDIARAFQAAGIVPFRTVRFAFWMGEEQGLVGSLAYIKDQAAAGNLDRIKLYVNIDMHGNPRGFDTEGRQEMTAFFQETGRRIKALGIDFEATERNKPSLFSDNVPFAVQGIPVMQMISDLRGGVYAYYHSDRDFLKLVEPEHMRRSSLIMAQALHHLAGAPNIPAGRLSKKDTRRLFEKYGIAGVLRKRGFVER